mgnify:CR=1 FL=1
MKTIAFVLAMLAATVAQAQVRFFIWESDGKAHSSAPPVAYFDDGRSVNAPSYDDAIAAGDGRWETDEEVAAREAVEAAQQAANANYEAAYGDPQPAVMVPRVGDAITNVVGESQLFVDDATGELFAVDETGSPEHTIAQKQVQAAARAQKRDAAKTAKGKGNGLAALAERVAALEALAGVE